MSYFKLEHGISEWKFINNNNTLIVYLFCLDKATYKETSVYGIPLKKGQLITTMTEIKNTYNLSIQEVRTALKHLEEEEVIERKTVVATDGSRKKMTIITIKNEGHPKSLTDVQQMVGDNSTDGLNNAKSKKALNKSSKFDSTNECVNTRSNTSMVKNQHIINEDKEYIKKSSSYSPLTGEQSEERMRTSFSKGFNEFWNVYPTRKWKRQQDKAETFKLWQHMELESHAKEIIMATQKYKESGDADTKPYNFLKNEQYKGYVNNEKEFTEELVQRVTGEPLTYEQLKKNRKKVGLE